MMRKLSKDEIKNKIEGNELDLSMCNLAKVPVREMLSLPKATIVDLSSNNLLSLPMLQYLNVQQSMEEREKQAMLAKEREKRENQLLEEKREKELRRRLKQQERQQKREAYDAMERQKKLMAEEMNRDLKGDMSYTYSLALKYNIEDITWARRDAVEDDGGILGIVLILIVVTIIVAIGLVVFCHHDTACRELLAALTS
ncbi:hypothetical protein QZH41_012514 [Actinostola sp. cb2023]|nr:hypothetical protein QZH41_012514 [Actinostola sp. cb2023]